MTEIGKPVEVGDVCSYTNGNEYIVTDGGPNLWTRCFLCGATACATPDAPLRTVRCGQCLARQSNLLPGQWAHEANARYAAEHAPPRWNRDRA